MIFGEYDREMDIAVNRKEAWEDGRKEEPYYYVSRYDTDDYEVVGLFIIE